MPQITISTTAEERAKVLEAVKEVEGQTVAVSVIASIAKLGNSRARYALEDLIEQGKVKRVATRAFNKHYVRYSYHIVQ